MGLLRRLDDLDTRVIGGGDPNWKSPMPKPWAPEMGPLIGVVPWTFHCGVAAVIAGLVGVPLAIASPNGEIEPGTVIGFVILAALVFLFWNRRLVFPRTDAALRVSSDVDVVPTRRPFIRWAGTFALTLACLTPVLVLNDVARFLDLAAYFLGMGLGSLYQTVEMTRFEDEHSVDLLRPRGMNWNWGLPKGYYARPRSISTAPRAAQP